MNRKLVASRMSTKAVAEAIRLAKAVVVVHYEILGRNTLSGSQIFFSGYEAARWEQELCKEAELYGYNVRCVLQYSNNGEQPPSAKEVIDRFRSLSAGFNG